MKISIICSSAEHPINSYLLSWIDKQKFGHEIKLVRKKDELLGGDILFLISCNEIIDVEVRKNYRSTLVIHASNLPEGRGWSPHIWQILEGKNDIVVTLLEAEDQVDSGAIWVQRHIQFEGHELYTEINAVLFGIELELIDFAIDNFSKIVPIAQDSRNSTYYRRRKPEDSRINPEKSILDQFNLLRVADFDRFPAFFNFKGKRYLIKIIKDDE
ncbi:MAG: UDP-glucuronic acid dehydrogenase [Candidatus Competibacteraceae bacterium]|nr:UDP-glucuronic acid dehydrogenase [Candidatus Competibacteraceae bacterium]